MSIYPASAIDRRLLDAAANYKSAVEMSEHVNGQLTPAQCAARVKELLNKKFTLTDFEERRLLLVQIVEHLNWLKGQRWNDKSWSAINRAFKLASDQIERTNITAEDITVKLSEAHARYFVDSMAIMLEAAVARVLEGINDDKGDMIEVDAEVMIEAIEAGVSAGQEYLGSVTEKDANE